MRINELSVVSSQLTVVNGQLAVVNRQLSGRRFFYGFAA
jgi:hypothetical protein